MWQTPLAAWVSIGIGLLVCTIMFMSPIIATVSLGASVFVVAWNILGAQQRNTLTFARGVVSGSLVAVGLFVWWINVSAKPALALISMAVAWIGCSTIVATRDVGSSVRGLFGGILASITIFVLYVFTAAYPIFGFAAGTVLTLALSMVDSWRDEFGAVEETAIH